MAVSLAFLGLAVNTWVALPTSRETELAGARVMLAGTGKVVFTVGLELLQLVRAATKLTTRKINANRTIAHNLPMHPPRPVGSAGRADLVTFWKTPSVEAGVFFGKLRRLRDVRAAPRNPERSEGCARSWIAGFCKI
jgi:hypothetical protein